MTLQGYACPSRMPHHTDWHVRCLHQLCASLLYVDAAPKGGINQQSIQESFGHMCLCLSAVCCCRLQPYARKVCAVLLAGLSACVVWSSATIFTGGHPDLSPFSLMIRSALHLTQCTVHVCAKLSSGALQLDAPDKVAHQPASATPWLWLYMPCGTWCELPAVRTCRCLVLCVTLAHV
jgi:hypothetical protein